MTLLSFLIGQFLVEHAAAQTLQTAGQGAPGVSDMWSTICSALYGNGTCPPGSQLIDVLSARIISFIFPMVGVTAVLLIMYAGIKIVTSDGSDDKVSEAKKIILYACIGVVLSLLVTVVLNFAYDFFHVIFG